MAWKKILTSNDAATAVIGDGGNGSVNDLTTHTPSTTISDISDVVWNGRLDADSVYVANVDIEASPATYESKCLQISELGTPVWGMVLPPNLLVSDGAGNGSDNTITENYIPVASATGFELEDSVIKDVSGAITIEGATTISNANNFTVGTGATALGGTLGVTGASTFTALTTHSGGIAADNFTVADGTGNTSITGTGTLGVAGPTTLSSTLGVTGAATLSSTLAVTGAATLSSTLAVTGATTISSTASITGKTTISDATPASVNDGALKVLSGGVSAANLYLSGDISNVAAITGDGAGGTDITGFDLIKTNRANFGDGQVTIGVATATVDEVKEELTVEYTDLDALEALTYTLWEAKADNEINILINNPNTGAFTLEADVDYYLPIQQFTMVNATEISVTGMGVPAGYITVRFHDGSDADLVCGSETSAIVGTCVLQSWPPEFQGYIDNDESGTLTDGDIAYGVYGISVNGVYATDPGDAIAVEFGDNVIFDAGGLMSQASNFSTEDQFIALNVDGGDPDSFAATSNTGIVLGRAAAEGAGNGIKGCKIWTDDDYLNITGLLDQTTLDVQDQQNSQSTAYKSVRARSYAFEAYNDKAAIDALTSPSYPTIAVETTTDQLYLWTA